MHRAPRPSGWDDGAMTSTPRGSRPGSPEGPTDWVSGERVFAPPTGTLDPDWLVPAVLAVVPEAGPTAARAAVVAAWEAVRAGREAPVGGALQDAAAAAVEEAVALFRAEG